MVTQAEMVKRIPASGVRADTASRLFTRNGSRFSGIASFGDDGDVSVLLETASTPEKKSRGLMGRTRMPACCGMLFSGLSGGAFWMKGCRVPLDIVFVKDGVVTIRYTMAADGGVKRYYYGDETDAIELPAGFCRLHGIGVGTPCTWRIW